MPTRRRFCLELMCLPLIGQAQGVSEPGVKAVRVWPAATYTRLTIESDVPLKHSMLLLREPLRLVVDMEGMSMNAVLREVASKIPPQNPVIGTVRVAQFKPGVVRLVMDLAQEVDAQVSLQAPNGVYAHRLLLDLTPKNAPDPIAQFLLELEKKASSAQVKHTKPWVVALDPGHGGEDPGAIGPTGLMEKEVTLAIALKLKARLEARGKVNVLLTRDGDYFVPLAERVKKARAVNADVFLSIHADAFTRPEASGSSVYMLSEKGASSAAAKYLANKENQADVIGGLNTNVKDPALAEMLVSLSQSASKQDSASLADRVLAQIGKINKLHKKAIEHAGFAVLRAPDVPSILIETAFISNPEEEERLRDEAFRTQVARSLELALVSYSKQKKFAQRPI